MHFAFKICQTVADICMTSQFHDFLYPYFWGIFIIWSHCAALCVKIQHSGRELPYALLARFRGPMHLSHGASQLGVWCLVQLEPISPSSHEQ